MNQGNMAQFRPPCKPEITGAANLIVGMIPRKYFACLSGTGRPPWKKLELATANLFRDPHAACGIRNGNHPPRRTSGMTLFAERQSYTIKDIEHLKTLDRAGVLKVLESFDERGMSDIVLARRLAERFAPDRVPGLQTALASGRSAVLETALGAAFAAGGAATPTSLVAYEDSMVDAILDHRFSFYGETYSLPEDIDWDFNPGSAHWAHDLNRFTFLYPLVAAWERTGQERYARKAVALILDWIRKADIGLCFRGTPYMFGSYLNNAIHCNAWCANLDRLYRAGLVSNMEIARILKSIYDQTAYLEVMTARHYGNWPTIGNRAMAEVLAAWPLEGRTRRWLQFIAANLDEQIAEQIYADGAQFELAPNYHWLVARNVLGVQKCLKQLGYSLPKSALQPLARMVRFTQQHHTPDGKLAAFNDADPERTAPIDHVLAETGETGLLSPPATLDSECFDISGRCFLRDRADRGDFYLAFDAGPLGAGHYHQDKLGFVLSAFGKQFLTDPGRHGYEFKRSFAYIGYLQGTAAHNTIRVDGKDQHDTPSRTAREQGAAKVAFSADPDEVRATACYDAGYGTRNEVRVAHERTIVFARPQRFWMVFDHVFGLPDDTEAEHDVEARFQFMPGPVVLDGNGARTNFADANLLIRTADMSGRDPDRVILRCGEETPRAGWYSPCTGVVLPAHQLAILRSGPLPLQTVTLLLPYLSYETPSVTLTYDGATARIALNGGPEIEIRRDL
jgi:hypothetical protein